MGAEEVRAWWEATEMMYISYCGYRLFGDRGEHIEIGVDRKDKEPFWVVQR